MASDSAVMAAAVKIEKQLSDLNATLKQIVQQLQNLNNKRP